MPAKTITLTDEVSEALDRFIAGQEPKQGRDEAVNALLADWLTREGILQPVECPPEVEGRGECE